MEIKRDYIGSADAHAIYGGRYDALIRSKMKDSDFKSARMQRGLTLERDIIEQYRDSGIHGLSVEATLDFQVRVTHPEMDFCKATLDGLLVDGPARIITEAKTSEHEAPEDEQDLMVKYSNYYYQVQWQMWLEGCGAVVLWCKCPPMESEESPYDEDGWLDITEIPVTPNPAVWKVFEASAPEFWEQWERAKESMTGGEDLSNYVDIGAYLAAVEEEAAIQKAIEEKVSDLIIKAEEAKKTADKVRAAMLEAMRDNNIVKYDSPALTVTYVAPSKKRSVDVDALKKAGLYDRYLKESVVKESIRIKVKEVEHALT